VVEVVVEYALDKLNKDKVVVELVV